MMTSNSEVITPQIADQWLGKLANPLNRNKKPLHIQIMAQDMSNGRWLETGQPIIFDEDGMLIDGHHRLQACIYAKRAFSSLVVRGVSRIAVDAIDIGKMRHVGEIAQMSGIKNGLTQAAICGIVMTYELMGINVAIGSKSKISKLEIIDRLRREDFNEAAKAGKCAQQMVRSNAVPGFCFYLFNKRSEKLANEFWADFLSDGAGLEIGNPVLALRNVLFRDLQSRTRLPLQTKAQYICKAWTLFVRGKKVQMLRIDKDEECMDPLLS
jgi:hypothetical protein